MGKKTYDEVFQAFSDKGYKLLTKEYSNNKQKLEYICPKHPTQTQTTRLNDLLSGHGCKLCGRERIDENLRKLAYDQRLKFEDIKKEIESHGFTLLSTNYKNAHQKLKIVCPNHKDEITEVRINDFRSGVYKCKHCAVEARTIPYEQVVDLFKQNGYEVLAGFIPNSNTPLKFKCYKHPRKDTQITYGSLRDGHKCFYCAIESISGENSPHYNHAISEEERALDRRYDSEHHRWRIAVFQRDNFTCQACGIFERNRVNAHHKDSHHWCIERRHDISNGVTLCVSCHKKFHSEYGYRYNTEEQFTEWILKIKEEETANVKP